jgi:multiple sugar transport system permease protein
VPGSEASVARPAAAQAEAARAAERAYRRARAGEAAFTVTRVAVLGLYLVFVVVPIAWLFVNSVKIPLEWLATPPVIVPSEVTGGNYGELFERNSSVPLALGNSIVITVAATAISVLVGSLAAYSFTHLRWRLVPILAGLVLLVGLYPKITAVIPYFVIVNTLGLLDTQISIIVAFVGLTLPQTVWVMMVFFNEIPPEIERSAMLDGCGPWRRFFRVVLPLAAPGLAVAAIMSALLCWVEFMIASSLAITDATTLPVVVSSFIQDKGTRWGPMAALAVVTVVPVIVFALAVQRYLVRGLTLGAVKG